MIKTIVTDNAANMAKMSEALKSEDSELLAYGCSAHLLNLLGDDVTPSNVIKHVKEINKYFRNHHKPCTWLGEMSSTKLLLPGETRWKSKVMCIESYLKNRSHLMQTVQDHEDEPLHRKYKITIYIKIQKISWSSLNRLQ